jgi:hypothetical protein
MAEMLGASAKSTYCRWETGSREFGDQYLRRLARITGISLMVFYNCRAERSEARSA